jgi:hypothetical protein
VRHRAVFRASTLLFALLAPTAATANTWPLYLQSRGTVCTEPPRLDQAAIVSERLEIQLRETDTPFDSHQYGKAPYLGAHVVARYEIEADEDRTVQMEFVAESVSEQGKDITHLGVSLDGKALAVGKPTRFEGPTEGLPSPRLLDGGPNDLWYPRKSLAGYPFELALTRGHHVLEAQYDAVPGWIAYPNSPAQFWQLDYYLAPARSWKAFKHLEIDLHVPKGWLVATEPALERRGEDRLSGTFEQIPFDYLAIKLAAPNNYSSLSTIREVGFYAAWIVTILVGLFAFRRRRGFLVGVGRAFLAIVCFFLIRLVTGYVVQSAADNSAHVSPAFLLLTRDPLTASIWMFLLFVILAIVAFVRWLVRRIRAPAPQETHGPGP